MRYVLIALLTLFSGMAAADEPAELAEGQVWTLEDPEYTTVRVVIGRIEPFIGGGTAVHISLLGLPPSAGIAGGRMPHLPFDHAALRASLGELVGEDQDPHPVFEEGYGIWAEDEGGVFTISVGELIEIIPRMMGTQ